MSANTKNALMIAGMVISWSIYYAVSKVVVGATGSAFLIPIGVPLLFVGLPGVIVMPLGGGLMVAGTIMLGCMGSQLQQSYDYYTQGQKRSLSINWHPTIGKDYAGFGMTMRF